MFRILSVAHPVLQILHRFAIGLHNYTVDDYSLLHYLPHHPFPRHIIHNLHYIKYLSVDFCAVGVPHQLPHTGALTILNISRQFAAVNSRNFFPTTLFKAINPSQPAFHPIFHFQIVGILPKMVLFRIVPCAFFRTSIVRHSPNPYYGGEDEGASGGNKQCNIFVTFL